jgi:hypothetical protein
MFSKRVIEHTSYEPLSLGECYQVLDATIQNYDQMMLVLKHYQYEYQKFFQELAEEIKEVISRNCNEIAQKEQKRILKEQQERQKANPNPQILAMSSSIQYQLFEIARLTGYAGILMLKKLYLMGKNLNLITSNQNSQKQILAETIEDIKSQKDWYELQIEINNLQAKNNKSAGISIDFEEYMKLFMSSFQDLISTASMVDKKLSKLIDETHNIASLMETQEFHSIESRAISF